MSEKRRPLPGRWVDQWVRELQDDLPTGVRLVLHTLGNHMDRRGRCWPSLTTIAKESGYDRRHVKRMLNQAVEAGWLQRKPGEGPSGRGGRRTLYVALERGRGTQAPTSRSGDIQHRSGDIHDTEVGTPMSPRTSSKERPVRTSKKTTDPTAGRIPSRKEFFRAFEAEDVEGIVTFVNLEGFDSSEARRIMDLANDRYEDHRDEILDGLRDLSRKSGARIFGRDKLGMFLRAGLKARDGHEDLSTFENELLDEIDPSRLDRRATTWTTK